jgi:hypothetical protein
MRKPTKPTFVLTLEALPRHDDASGMRRLRGALKSLLRAWGLRCTKLDFPDAAEPADADAEYARPFDQETR